MCKDWENKEKNQSQPNKNTHVLKLADEDIRTVIIIVFHMLKEIKER